MSILASAHQATHTPFEATRVLSWVRFSDFPAQFTLVQRAVLLGFSVQYIIGSSTKTFLCMPRHLVLLTFAKTIFQHFSIGLPRHVSGCSSYSWECAAPTYATESLSFK